MLYERSKSCLLAIAGILLGGCATSLSLSPDPGVNALMKGQVHVSKIRSSDDEDMYRAHYVVFARADDVWEMTRDLRDWIRTLEVVEDIQVLLPVRSDEEADIFKVKWKRGEEQTVVIRRDELARKIEIAVDPDSQGVGRLGHCRIKVTPFVDDNALVVIDLRVDSSFGKSLIDIFLVVFTALDANSVDAFVEDLAEQLARVHRQAVEVRPPPALGRTHIISIGVESLRAADLWREKSRIAPLQWATEDAEAFYDWASRVHPAEKDAELMRVLYTEEEPTRNAVSNILADLEDPDGAVRPGDTVLFFFSGHVVLARDSTEFGDNRYEYPHLVLCDSQPGRYIPGTSININRITDAFRRSNASRCILFSDACYGGGRRIEYGKRNRHARRVKGTPVPLGDRKTLILAAARYEAFESDTLEHGVFSSALLSGLDGAADENQDGFVAISELAKFVIRETQAFDQIPVVDGVPESDVLNTRWPVPRDHTTEERSD